MPTRIPGSVRRIPGMQIQRLLPHRQRRSIGTFCFLDVFGPTPVPADSPGIGPHPHIGLQTATWLFDGAMEHGDSEDFTAVIRPGQLNLMTAGRGIAHWERMRPDLASTMHGVQLWIALPDAARHIAPTFEQLADPPTVTIDDWTATVFVGALGSTSSPATVHAPMVGAELRGTGTATLTLDPTFEHGLLLARGTATADGNPLQIGELLAFDPGSSAVEIHGDDALVLLLGGPPLDEPLLLWWNFVARTHEEIEVARANWAARTGYGDPSTWPTDVIEAPPMSRSRLVARTR